MKNSINFSLRTQSLDMLFIDSEWVIKVIMIHSLGNTNVCLWSVYVRVYGNTSRSCWNI